MDMNTVNAMFLTEDMVKVALDKGDISVSAEVMEIGKDRHIEWTVRVDTLGETKLSSVLENGKLYVERCNCITRIDKEHCPHLLAVGIIAERSLGVSAADIVEKSGIQKPLDFKPGTTVDAAGNVFQKQMDMLEFYVDMIRSDPKVKVQPPPDTSSAGVPLYKRFKRYPELDDLMTEIARIQSSGIYESIIIQGPTGTGKSHLTRYYANLILQVPYGCLTCNRLKGKEGVYVEDFSMTPGDDGIKAVVNDKIKVLSHGGVLVLDEFQEAPQPWVTFIQALTEPETLWLEIDFAKGNPSVEIAERAITILLGNNPNKKSTPSEKQAFKNLRRPAAIFDMPPLPLGLFKEAIGQWVPYLDPRIKVVPAIPDNVVSINKGDPDIGVVALQPDATLLVDETAFQHALDQMGMIWDKVEQNISLDLRPALYNYSRLMVRYLYSTRSWSDENTVGLLRTYLGNAVHWCDRKQGIEIGQTYLSAVGSRCRLEEVF